MANSGPPYPPNPVAGSNKIGSFIIGISPIGPIATFDSWKTIISQYANSDILTTLIQNLDEAIDQTADFNLLFDTIWNVDSAQGFGLDVWGRIVGVDRVLTVAASTFFGFEEQSPTVDTFGPGGQSPFYSGTPATSNFSLTDEAYRQLIFAKALANICDGSVPAINQILMNLFGNSGKCYVTDNGDMTMTYTFLFLLNPVQKAIVGQSGVLPKPVGVTANFVQLY
jgi:hypothetical protein